MIREEIILKRIKNKHILDIGSLGQTDSYSLWRLYKNSNLKSLTGIDLPSAEINAKEQFKVEHIPHDTRIVEGNMENFEFNRKFDVVVAGDVIEHVSNQGLFLQNIHRHLYDDGELIITTPNAKWPTVFLRPNPTHTLWHDIYTLERILSLSGFKITYKKFYYGNKKNYYFFLKPLIYKQGLLVICKKQ